MRITIDARFQAGKRLESLNTYTFITSIIISLALIFLPLIQFSDIKLHYSNNVLSTLQIFFAVAILVYSVLISTATSVVFIALVSTRMDFPCLASDSKKLAPSRPGTK
ncbi:hypothetical protein [Serratia marcescens]|uniref:hypothetical protein n=1 Tax=Serratia marcescens TaxID=615 RepID=UPI0039C9DE67